MRTGFHSGFIPMRLILLLAGVLLISGCTVKFGYNNLDWLVHWYIDDYVDLDQQQRQQFNVRMDRWLDWHKDSELPRYRDQLAELQQQVIAGGLTARQWHEHLERLRQHWSRSRNQLGTLMVPLAKTLTDEQVTGLIAELQDQDDVRREDEAAETPGEDREERFDRLFKRLQSWLGQLDDEQIAILDDYVADYQGSFLLRMEYRSRLRQAAAALLAERNNSTDFESRLLFLVQHPEAYQGSELSMLRHQRSLDFAGFLADTDQSLSVYQRQHLVGEIQDLIDDLDDLMLPSYGD